ncbi:HGxxPAAW family protein [Arthrobacter roseus]|uniref:HGxxPAAW family protein n=1 Tax=Arthrobacter roseus TaxID=136274 RepID=UPI00196689A6|nr:HGxxPAAW family protein [Arthrobacter roseus]MBM7848428.1 hypothetical protein [Arthrobacter roseus]
MAKSPVSPATSTTADAQVNPTVDRSIHDEAVGHGNSPAAWSCVLVMILGAAIASIGYIMASHPVFWSGVAVMFVGLLVGYIMKKAGYGVGGHKLKNNGH